MSRRKQTTPNKVHCEYNVTQHCGILALARLLWSEMGRRGMVRRYSLWGNGGYSCFVLGTVKRETELCASGAGCVLARQDRGRLEQTTNAVKVGVCVQGL